MMGLISPGIKYYLITSVCPFATIYKRNLFTSYLKPSVDLLKNYSYWKPLITQPRMTLCADVYTIPVRTDNFSYLIVDRDTNQAACVDPYTPDKIFAKVDELGVDLVACLTTHKHWDHSGGNEELQKKSKKRLSFIASAYEEVPCTTHPKQHRETFNLGSLLITAFHAPCHTKGHLLYYVTNVNVKHRYPVLFTGDTLFIAGCGRFFEGTAEEMVENMKLIRNLNPDTRIFVGHEYTVENLEFAKSLEPNNKIVMEKLRVAKENVQKGSPTVPSVLSEEMTYNPFMRFDDPDLMKAVGTKDAVSTMQTCRAKKNQFK